MAKKYINWKTKGMNRDMSVSAFNPEFAFENHNLRLATNEGNTMMSWVNERGPKELNLLIDTEPWSQVESEGKYVNKIENAALKAAYTVSEFLMRDDILDMEDGKGKPKYQISSITSALKNVEGIVSSLQNLQRKVESELSEQSKARGSQELTILDEVD